MIDRSVARTAAAALAAALLAAPAAVSAYPGGTPDFQTDVAPFCAACHSSLTAEALDGSGPRAEKELAANKHLAGILQGQAPYDKLSEADRATLAQQLQAVDANSKIELVEYPPTVKPGASFNVTVSVTGGAGPAVGVGLVDRAHRWYARPASSLGWTVVGPPTVIGPDGKPQRDWLDNRPERMGRKVTFVNITGVESDAVAGKWSKSKVIYTLQAPDRPGEYPLVGAYLYGTEKATTLGSTVHPVYGKQPLGGYGGKSGRVRFSEPITITVK
jgi:hypothetical protein